MKTMMISALMMMIACVALAACGGSDGKPAGNGNKSGGCGGGDDTMRLPVPDAIAAKESPTALDDAAFIKMGKELYENVSEGNCVMCHGTSGKADTDAAKNYTDPNVSDLTSVAFQDAVTDQYIYWRLADTTGSKAYPNSGMLGYMAVTQDGEITDADAKKIWAVVAYVRSLKGK